MRGVKTNANVGKNNSAADRLQQLATLEIFARLQGDDHVREPKLQKVDLLNGAKWGHFCGEQCLLLQYTSATLPFSEELI